MLCGSRDTAAHNSLHLLYLFTERWLEQGEFALCWSKKGLLILVLVNADISLAKPSDPTTRGLLPEAGTSKEIQALIQK